MRHRLMTHPHCYLKNLLSCLMVLSSKCCPPPYQDAGRCIQTSVFLGVIPGFAVFSAMEFIFHFLNIHRISFCLWKRWWCYWVQKYEIYFNLARKWIKKASINEGRKIIFLKFGVSDSFSYLCNLWDTRKVSC